MADLFVSNANMNARSLGNDATAQKGSTTFTYLTISAAKIAATAGVDRIYVNPTGIPYSESTSGVGYLNLDKANIIVEADPAIFPTAGPFEVTHATANVRTINIGANGITLRNVIVDAANATGNVNAIVIQGVTGFIPVNIKGKNLAGSSALIGATAASTGSFTLDKVYASIADGNASTARFLQVGSVGAGCNITYKGCTAVGIQSFFYSASASGSFGTFTFMKADDGTPNTVDQCQYGIKVPEGTSVIAGVNVQYVNFQNMADTGGFAFYDGGTPQTTISSFFWKYNTYVGAQQRAIFMLAACPSWYHGYSTYAVSGPCRAIQVRSVDIVNPLDEGSTYISTSTTADVVLFDNVGANLAIRGSTFISPSGSSHHLGIGGDGYFYPISSTVTTGAAQLALGNLSTNQYASVKFTHVANTSQYRMTSAAAFMVKMRKVGSPPGTVTAQLYTDNAGKPGTLIDTATYVLPANPSNFASPFSWVEFTFLNFPTIALSTTYHLVLQNSVVNASNHWQIDTTTVVGSTDGSFKGINTSADGTTWTTDNAKTWNVALCQLNREASNVELSGCTFRSTNTDTSGALQHTVILNGVNGATIKYNWLDQCQGIGILLKLADGRTYAINGYGNLIRMNKGGTSDGQALRDKGSESVNFLNNTIVIDDSAAVCEYYGADYVASGGTYYPCYNGRASNNATSKNNILVRSSGVAGYIYQLGAENGTNCPNVTNFTQMNDMVFATGSTTFARVGAANYDAAGWAGLGYGTGNVYGNPMLRSLTPTKASDFVPLPASLARGSGVNLTGTVATDYAGASWTVPMDIGAFKVPVSSDRFVNYRDNWRTTWRTSWLT